MLLGVVGAATLAVCLALAYGPGLAPANAFCPHAKAGPHETTLPKLRKAMTCLINHKRERKGRHRLTPNADLKLAAQRHNNVMLAKDCFEHHCPGEPGLNRRVRRTGYTKGQDAWRIAEDLGFDNTPQQMLKRLLGSPFNRRNLLERSFRDIGVGIGGGAPKPNRDDSRFATYTIVFAWRQARR